ncbi:MAG: hypothetical protein ACREJ4_05875 [Candidatus Methylomirabilaceae bacterium]
MAGPSVASLGRSLEATVDLLRQARIPYMVIGAVAVAIWGRPRTTLDVDIAVLTDQSGLRRLASAAMKRAFVVDEKWAKLNPMIRDSQVRLLHRSLPVDLILPMDRHDRDALKRRKRKRWRDRVVWFASPEDLILQKLKVGRPRDFEDALSIWHEQGKVLDKRYLWAWAGRLGIKGELEYIARGIRA